MLNLWIARKEQRDNDEISSDEDEESDPYKMVDNERLTGIKDLLFDLGRDISGEEVLSVPLFIDFILEATKNSKDTFGSSLF